jgi:hypothetical protein
MRFSRGLFCLFLPLALLLASCGGPIESITFKSPNGDRSIDVSGERTSPAGPIKVTVKLNVPKSSKSFTFQHQASSLTKDNVTATWNNNARCKLTFKLDDGETWEVETFLLDDKQEAVKRFKYDGKTLY